MTIWMDLTNSLTQRKVDKSGVVPVELMVAKYLHELYPSMRFSIVLKQGFKEVRSGSLAWLWKSKDVAKDYATYQKSRRKLLNKLFSKIDYKLFKFAYRQARHHRPKGMPKKEFIIWPYKDEDIVFRVSNVGTTKEHYFQKVKRFLPNLKLVYTVYDLAILRPSLRGAYSDFVSGFEVYLRWICENCDAVFYAGKTTKDDMKKYCKEKDLAMPDGADIHWGCEFKNDKSSHKDILRKLQIDEPYVLAEGDFDWKQNYQILYRAYCWAKTQNIDLPTLVIAGKVTNDKDLAMMFTENVLLYNKVKIISVNREELQALYQNCLFTLFPALYDGWSRNILKSLSYNKLCLCSDAAPLRETGGDFCCYLNPNHPAEWAKNIAEFANNAEKLKAFEQKIAQHWHPLSWRDVAEDIKKKLSALAEGTSLSGKALPARDKEQKIKIYYDLGLILYQLTGIPRTQMLLARNLYRLRKDIEFFYIQGENYYRIPTKILSNVLGDEKVDVAVATDKMKLPGIRCEIPFTKDSIVFTTGIGFESKTQRKLEEMHQKIGFKFVATVFDLTPITVPFTHPKERVEYYPKFLKQAYALSDIIVYGGKTAQQDGENFQKANNLPITPSLAVKWGNDLVFQKHSKAEVNKILEKCGVSGDYILTVGTIEARKNHKILYDAYLELLNDRTMQDKMPQLVICGHPGWKTADFTALLANDERIKDKIIIFSPTDEELDVLYQNCKFTCLASVYEGWSLTLPESLNYGKFCLTADTPSLKETGEDIVDYANPYDPHEWAEKIKYYMSDKTALKNKEKLIKEKWHNTTWFDCAKHINNFFESLEKDK